MINSKITRQTNQPTTEERLFKLLEGIDWKLWEMYNMMKKDTEQATPTLKKATAKTSVSKRAETTEDEE